MEMGRHVLACSIFVRPMLMDGSIMKGNNEFILYWIQLTTCVNVGGEGIIVTAFFFMNHYDYDLD